MISQALRGVGIALLLWTGLLGPGEDANVRMNVTGVTFEAFVQNETTIVEFNYNDPNDMPDQGVQDVILSAWNDHRASGAIEVGYGRSVDGATFQHAALAGAGHLLAPGTATGGDPVLAVDRHADGDGLGNPLVHLAQVGIDDDRRWNIYTALSGDGGRTFPALGYRNASQNSGPAGSCATPSGGFCDDKPWIAVDQRGGARPPDGNVYVCWTRLHKDEAGDLLSQILLVQASPFGLFGTPIPITTQRKQPGFVQGCQVAVDAEGHVYVAWVEFLDEDTHIPWIMLRHAPPPATSTPPAFDPRVWVTQLRRVASLPRGNVQHCSSPHWMAGMTAPFMAVAFNLSYPSLATDPFSGDIYLTWSMWNGPRDRNGANRFDVFFKRGLRPGSRPTFGGPVRVNDDPSTVTDQFLPAITTYPLPVSPVPLVKEVGVKIQWYDKRNSSDNDAFEIYAAESPFFPNTLVSDGGPQPMHIPGAGVVCRPGDYNGITSGVLTEGSPDGAGPGTYFMHSWTDTRAANAASSEVVYQSQAFDPGSVVDVPQALADLRAELFATQLPGYQIPLEAPLTIDVDLAIGNAGPFDATVNTWLVAPRSPGLSSSWVPRRGDACYGPVPSVPGPITPTGRVDCEAQVRVDVLAIEEDVAANTQQGHSRSIVVECLTEGSFTLELTAGTGPVLPLDVADGDLSNNGLKASAMIACLPSPFPPTPSNLRFDAKEKLAWDAVQTAASYRLHRGEPALLAALEDARFDSCLRATTNLPSFDLLDEIPPAGSLFWYLPASVDSGGVESAGGGRIVNSLGDCSICGHDVCSTDGVLSTQCNDACISQICAQDPFCCQSSWDPLCVQEVRTICDRLVCAESHASCAHAQCETGPALVDGCDDAPAGAGCVSAICQTDPFCCDSSFGAWDAACVDQVLTVCGLGCL